MMIISRIKIALQTNARLSALPTNLLNRSWGFSTIKNKAQKFLCAAIAYHTLTNIDTKQLYILKPALRDTNYNDILSNKTQKIDYEPYSLREKVIHNVNMLNLKSEESRQAIRSIFEIEHGLQLRSMLISSKLVLGSRLNNTLKQIHFVFNPTLLFKQIADKIAENTYSSQFRKIYAGMLGTGKTSNQLLLAYLTRILFLFRKEGREAQPELEELLKRNEQALKQIMPLTQTEKYQIQNKTKTFFDIVKQKFYKIPLVFFFSLPQQRFIHNILGIQKADFLGYLSGEQLKKIKIAEITDDMSYRQIIDTNVQNATLFFQAIERRCRQNGIAFTLIIDQIELFFNKIRQKTKLQKIHGFRQEEVLSDNDKYEQYRNIYRMVDRYSLILNHIATMFPITNIILTASQKVSWNENTPEAITQYWAHDYATFFFNKQVSITKQNLQYSRRVYSELWQKEMDIVFIFQLERSVHKLLQKDCQVHKMRSPNYKQKIVQMMSHLKYRYYKQMNQNRQSYQKWQDETNYLLIRQSFAAEEAKMKLSQMFKNIVNFLVESEMANNKQLIKDNQKINKNLFLEILDFKKIIKSGVKNAYKQYLLSQQKRGIVESQIHLKELFLLHLYDKVEHIAKGQSNRYQVIISNQMLKDMLRKSNIPHDLKYSYLELLINKDYQQLIDIEGKKALKNPCCLQELKRRLLSLTLQIQFPAFLFLLRLDNIKTQAFITQVIVKRTFLSTKIDIIRQDDPMEEFNIINQQPVFFNSLWRDDSIYRAQTTKFEMAAKLQEKAEQINRSFIQGGEQFESILELINQRIANQTEKLRVKKLSRESISFITFCKQNKITVVSQQIIRKWRETNRVNKMRVSNFKDYWHHAFKSFSHNQKIIKVKYPTYGLKPVNKQEQLKKSQESHKQPYFDLVLIKKLPQANQKKKYKFIFIDVTISTQKQEYQNKIRGIVDFKDFFLLNNKSFFEQLQVQFWHLCPQTMINKHRIEFQDMYATEQKKRDQINGVSSQQITYRLVNFDDLKLTSDNKQTMEQYQVISNFINSKK